MPGGRHTKPLYEFLREDRAREAPQVSSPTAPTAAPSTPTNVVEPKPPPTRGVERVESMSTLSGAGPRSTPPRPVWGKLGGRPLLISSTGLYVLAAGVLLLVLIVWYLGVTWGRTDARRDFERNYGPSTPTPTISEPAAVPAPATPEPRRSPSPAPVATPPSAVPKSDPKASPPARPQPPLASLPASIPGDGPILTLRGATATDPRVAGKNYLSLGRFPRPIAEQAVLYLAGNGVDAIAILALDKDRKPTKNPALFDVMLLEGITSDEFRAKDRPPRATAEATVRRLGQAWQKQGGPSDFRQPAWVRYSGPTP